MDKFDKIMISSIAGASLLLIGVSIGIGVYSARVQADLWNQCNPDSQTITTTQMFWGADEMLRIEECKK